MTDIVDAARRSWNMGRIPSKDTEPELILRSSLQRYGFRFRLHRKNLPGRPDIVFPKYRVAMFVHGCFWHRHGCRRTYTPKSRIDYWTAKFERNVARDSEQHRKLIEAGWRVVTVWECAVKELGAAEVVERFAEWLPKGELELQIPKT